MEKLFVYGTLKQGGWNNRYLQAEDVKYLGEGKTVKAFRLFAHDGFPFACKKTGDTPIQGELYEVGDETLALCDRLEGHPRFYCREQVKVRMDNGKTVKAWLYFITALPGNDYVVEIPDGIFPASNKKWEKKYRALLKKKRSLLKAKRK